MLGTEQVMINLLFTGEESPLEYYPVQLCSFCNLLVIMLLVPLPYSIGLVFKEILGLSQTIMGDHGKSLWIG